MRALLNTACVRCCVLAAILGCSESSSDNNDATVQGTITIDGALAPNGTVSFYPVDGGPVAVGSIARDGSFSLRIGQGNARNLDRSGIPSGEYVVTVVATGPSERGAVNDDGGPLPFGPSLIAHKYANRETSELKATVNKGPNVLDFKLDGPWANPPKEVEAEEPPEENAKANADQPSSKLEDSSAASAPAADAPAPPPADGPATGLAVEETAAATSHPETQSPSKAEDRPE